jgi:hypothetical protein
MRPVQDVRPRERPPLWATGIAAPRLATATPAIGRQVRIRCGAPPR